MTLPQDQGGQALTGNAHNRFVSVASLLFLIDPVRGEPTAYSLDRHPHDNASNKESLLKKFLDSFALACSTSRKGAETASAVCLEQDHPSGSVLRIARNLGVPQDLVNRLQAILVDMIAIALRGELLPYQAPASALALSSRALQNLQPVRKRMNSCLRSLSLRRIRFIASSRSFVSLKYEIKSTR